MDQVFVVRHKVIVEGPAQREWPKVFGGDKKLTTALLDRLALHAAVCHHDEGEELPDARRPLVSDPRPG